MLDTPEFPTAMLARLKNCVAGRALELKMLLSLAIEMTVRQGYRAGDSDDIFRMSCCIYGRGKVSRFPLHRGHTRMNMHVAKALPRVTLVLIFGLTIPVKNEIPIRVEMTWSPQ